MSFLVNNQIKFSDSPNLDAFSRLRISEPFSLFQSSFVLTSGDTYFETILTSGGTVTYSPNTVDYTFSVTSSGDSAINEQHGYNYYYPGKSQLIFLTGIFGDGINDVRKRMGYFNDNDGLFFEYSGTSFGVVLRTSTSGVPIDTFIPQDEWNIDTLNTGSTLNPSGYHLDLTKTNIYIINFQWLGVGRVVFGLDIDGQIVPVHQILNANNKTAVYMKQAVLPIRYEVISEGGSDNTFKQICSSVISEGGQEDYGYNKTVSNGLTTRTFSTKQSVISVRLSNTFEGKINRLLVKPIKVELISTTNSVSAYWELIHQRGYLGETNLGGTPTWSGLTNSPLEYSVDGTTVSGGTTIDSGYVQSTTQGGGGDAKSIVDSKIILSLDYSGTTSDWLHLVITPSTSSAWAGALTLKCLY